MTTPILTIVRGLPGSGKSYRARDLAAHFGVMLIEPEALLVCGGEYIYTPERYKLACKRSMNLVKNLLETGVDVVYADVLPRLDDVGFILWIIREFSDGMPDVQVVDMPLLTVEESIARNRHAVRREDIERMAATWEPWEVNP